MKTVYASFSDHDLAEKATGALLDHGVRAEDISLVASEVTDPRVENVAVDDEYNTVAVGRAGAVYEDQELGAKTGLSTTTGADAASGAAKGAGIGLGRRRSRRPCLARHPRLRLGARWRSARNRPRRRSRRNGSRRGGRRRDRIPEGSRRSGGAYRALSAQLRYRRRGACGDHAFQRHHQHGNRASPRQVRRDQHQRLLGRRIRVAVPINWNSHL